MAQIVGFAYCSKPTEFSFEQIEEILQTSRRNNARDGLTGALIYNNRTFLQWLEGEPDRIRDVFRRISDDTRHTGISLLTVRKLEDRWFPDWSMTAAVTEDETLRSLRLVPHLSLAQFHPFDWSEGDVIAFMAALSDYLTRRPAPASQELPEDTGPRMPVSDPVTRLDRHLDRIL